MIHSKEKTANEVFKFSKSFINPNFLNLWLLYQVLTQAITEDQLKKNGFSIVIYANQMLRASYPAMKNAAIEILKNKRAKEIDKKNYSDKRDN